MVADVIEHPMGCGAVPGIKHLKRGSDCGDVPAPGAEPGRGNTAHGELQAPLWLLRDLKLHNYVFPAFGTHGCVIQLPLLLWRGDSSAAQAKASSFPCSQPAAVPALSPNND